MLSKKIDISSRRERSLNFGKLFFQSVIVFVIFSLSCISKSRGGSASSASVDKKPLTDTKTHCTSLSHVFTFLLFSLVVYNIYFYFVVVMFKDRFYQG